ncbi:F-box/kelch-repeat protein At3g06240-like, partial [Spinacia oleracea]|uniref:F-box/kelch-repeat protein At3g06240-like n=1 Tax=Spinacia oleracea TaxID=3562 RepID=A0A9R0J648_SPIOL
RNLLPNYLAIGRFRCVSKPWKSLLTQPHFIKTHLDRTKHLLKEEQSLIFVSDDDGSLYSAQLNNAHHMFDEITVFATKLNFDDHYFYPSKLSDVTSCDGLILMNGSGKSVLVNPTTMAIKELPVSPCTLEPNASITLYGFGYDTVNDDYKVVTVSFGEFQPHCNEAFVNVYSVKRGTWKSVESSPYNHAVNGHQVSGVLVDGFVHWLVRKVSDKSVVIAAFGFGEEKFHEVPLPSSVDNNNFDFALDLPVALRGCLCLIPSSLFFAIGVSNVTDVWIMKEYGVEKSWTKIKILHDYWEEFKPLYLLEEKEELVLVKVEEESDERLVMYNMKEGTFKDIVVRGIPFYNGTPRAVATFTESLVSPHCCEFDEDAREF